MATTFWKRRLERLGEQFSNCEAVELSMIREAKPVNGASHNAYLADLVSDAFNEAECLDQSPTKRPILDDPASIEELARRHVRQSRVKQKMLSECPWFGIGDVKFGSIAFYAPSLLTMPRNDARRIWNGLDTLFVDAGGVLEGIPQEISQRLSPLAHSLRDRKLRWAACVFDLALRLKRVEITYLQGQPRPGCWFTTLENVMASSVELIDWLLADDDTPADPPNAADDSASVAAKPPREQRGKRMTIDQRMKLLLFEKPESSGWSITEFETELKCSRAGIHKTASWKALEAARKLGKAERRNDRRAKTR